MEILKKVPKIETVKENWKKNTFIFWGEYYITHFRNKRNNHKSSINYKCFVSFNDSFMVIYDYSRFYGENTNNFCKRETKSSANKATNNLSNFGTCSLELYHPPPNPKKNV